MPASAPDDDRQFAEDLRRAAEGDIEARNRLWATHYETLHQCATGWLADQRRRGKHHDVSLGGTDIVNLAYQRMHDRTAAMVRGKQYFFAAFYTECLRIVVDHYRQTRNDKGHGKIQRVDVELHGMQDPSSNIDFEVLVDLLNDLERQDPQAGLVAKLKVLEARPVDGKPGTTRGLTNQEVADLLGMGLRTVEGHWSFASAWLVSKLRGSAG